MQLAMNDPNQVVYLLHVKEVNKLMPVINIADKTVEMQIFNLFIQIIQGTPSSRLCIQPAKK